LIAVTSARNSAGVLVGDLDAGLEVAAGEEGLLRRGDDHAGDRVLLGVQPVDGLVHRLR
jgi:hypothetical protein